MDNKENVPLGGHELESFFFLVSSDGPIDREPLRPAARQRSGTRTSESATPRGVIIEGQWLMGLSGVGVRSRRHGVKLHGTKRARKMLI